MSVHARPTALAFIVVAAAGLGCPARRGGHPKASGLRGPESVDAEWVPDVQVMSRRLLPVERPPVAALPQVVSDAGIVALSSGSEGGVGDQSPQSLQFEESESDPGSETVTIKVSVDYPKCAHVFWGVKDLGVAPLEFRRPRGSGPMDLLVRCAGMLTVHTRVFTDRDDRIAIHLFRETEASAVFGYRPPGL